MDWLDKLAEKLNSKSTKPEVVIPAPVKVAAKAVKPKRQVGPPIGTNHGPCSLSVSTRIAKERGLPPPPTPWIKSKPITMLDCEYWAQVGKEKRAMQRNANCNENYDRY